MMIFVKLKNYWFLNEKTLTYNIQIKMLTIIL